MDKALEIINKIIAEGGLYLGAVDAVILALIALFLLIPGEQPEKFLKGVADFLAKFSRKPKV